LFFRLIKSDPGALKTIFSFSDYHKKYGQIYSLLSFLALRKKEFCNYDIIHAHFGTYGTLGIFLRDIYTLKAKVITSFHGYDLNVIPRKHGSTFYDKLFQQGDCFTVNSSFSSERLQAIGCPQKKIIKIPFGVDLANFPFKKRNIHAGEEIRLLSVARLVEVKGLQYAITALAKLKNRYPTLRYSIIGDGPLRNDLAGLTKKLGLDDNIKFLGVKPFHEVLQFYSQAHVFILPSIIGQDGAQEAQGLSLIEAQASGLPVLSTRVGGIPESVVDGETGFLVPPEDSQALADKLEVLLRNPQLYSQMGQNGRGHVEKNFNNELLNKLLVDTYAILLDS
jgi:colanic acid/amylovoran biosynthesis glycosyltransferase